MKIRSGFVSNSSSKPVQIKYKENLKNRISILSELKENWDGYGAIEIDSCTILNSNMFIERLPEVIARELKEDNIMPTPYGTIVYDWEKDGETISVEIGKSKIGFFTEFKNNKNFLLDESLFNEHELPDELSNAFKIFYRSISL